MKIYFSSVRRAPHVRACDIIGEGSSMLHMFHAVSSNTRVCPKKRA